MSPLCPGLLKPAGLFLFKGTDLLASVLETLGMSFLSLEISSLF